jgi:hypothetical protein
MMTIGKFVSYNFKFCTANVQIMKAESKQKKQKDDDKWLSEKQYPLTSEFREQELNTKQLYNNTLQPLTKFTSTHRKIVEKYSPSTTKKHQSNAIFHYLCKVLANKLNN